MQRRLQVVELARGQKALADVETKIRHDAPFTLDTNALLEARRTEGLFNVTRQIRRIETRRRMDDVTPLGDEGLRKNILLTTATLGALQQSRRHASGQLTHRNLENRGVQVRPCSVALLDLET